MKFIPVFCLSTLLLCRLSAANVAAYPALSGRPASDLYQVTVNGQPVWTEKFHTAFDLAKLPDWFTKATYTGVQQELHITDFSGTGSLDVAVQLKTKVNTVSIHPLSRGIQARIEGDLVHFTLAGPDKVYVVINDLPPLCVFANPPEGPAPQSAGPLVRYFGPGVHRPGLMTLKSNETVYLAAGALVYGGLRLAAGATHVRVLGRGVLDGDFHYESMVLLENGHDITVSGITIRNGDGWTNTLTNCTDVTYEGVKVISFGPGGDGIDPLGSSNVTIEHCFFRCTDDCIAIKAPDPRHVVKNVRIAHNTMVGFACSDGVTIGFETNGPEISGVRVSDCDVIQARGGSRVDGHSAFSIICDGPAVIHDIVYEDIRAEADVLKLFELHITDGTKYGTGPAGHIRGVHLRNITWTEPRPVILQGFDASHRVQDVTFENCRVQGRRLEGPVPAHFQVNGFVDDVKFR